MLMGLSVDIAISYWMHRRCNANDHREDVSPNMLTGDIGELWRGIIACEVYRFCEIRPFLTRMSI